MTDNIIEYKGYHTRVECSLEDGVLFGKIEGIQDLVTFECETIAEAKKAFQEAVDDYLSFCNDVGKDPQKEYKGVFQVRIDPELHKETAIAAFKENTSLNAFVVQAIKEKLKGEKQPKQIVYYYIDVQSQTHRYETRSTKTAKGRMDYAPALSRS